MTNDKVSLKLSTCFMRFACVSGAFGQSNSSFCVSTTGNDSNPGIPAAPSAPFDMPQTQYGRAVPSMSGWSLQRTRLHEGIRKCDGWIHYVSKLSRVLAINSRITRARRRRQRGISELI
jgi:hypothetical protein